MQGYCGYAKRMLRTSRRNILLNIIDSVLPVVVRDFSCNQSNQLLLISRRDF